MTATVPFDDILSAMPDDERAAVEARAAEMLDEIDGLAEVCPLAGLKQGQVFGVLSVKQTTVRQIKRPQGSSDSR